MTTSLLEKAFEEASKLPEEAQDRLAAQVLEELKDEGRWSEAFDGSGSKLDQLADEALRDYREGRTKELGFDQL